MNDQSATLKYGKCAPLPDIRPDKLGRTNSLECESRIGLMKKTRVNFPAHIYFLCIFWNCFKQRQILVYFLVYPSHIKGFNFSYVVEIAPKHISWGNCIIFHQIDKRL